MEETSEVNQDYTEDQFTQFKKAHAFLCSHQKYFTEYLICLKSRIGMITQFSDGYREPACRLKWEMANQVDHRGTYFPLLLDHWSRERNLSYTLIFDEDRNGSYEVRIKSYIKSNEFYMKSVHTFAAFLECYNDRNKE